MTTPSLDPDAVISRLAAARVQAASGLAFDADGTLWSGDVGEDVFEWSTAKGLLRRAPEDDLARVAGQYGIPVGASTSETARSLYEGYRRGVVPEPLMCEVMTWCYSGYATSELVDIAREAFAARDLRGRARASLWKIKAWADTEEIRSVVVSASPRSIVEEALRATGFSVFEVAGAVPKSNEGVIAPAMAEPLTYGPVKTIAGKRLLENYDWLGSFGDNVFDIEMLLAARVGVAVHPKPALRARLSELPHTVVLE